MLLAGFAKGHLTRHHGPAELATLKLGLHEALLYICAGHLEAVGQGVLDLGFAVLGRFGSLGHRDSNLLAFRGFRIFSPEVSGWWFFQEYLLDVDFPF